jgi:hypothetical protein|tara:strand:+ start:624 stop:821 length:198 start_codon:yes stop_codon:yes gene_type:complete
MNAEQMMFEGDARFDYDTWMEEMKGVFIKPNSGEAMAFQVLSEEVRNTPVVSDEEVVDLEDIDFV